MNIIERSGGHHLTQSQAGDLQASARDIQKAVKGFLSQENYQGTCVNIYICIYIHMYIYTYIYMYIYIFHSNGLCYPIHTSYHVLKARLWRSNTISLTKTCLQIKHTVKINALKKQTCCIVNLQNHVFANIFIFKFSPSYLHTGCNIYLGELIVGHRTSISFLSFSIIFAVLHFNMLKKCFQEGVFYQHVLEIPC